MKKIAVLLVLSGLIMSGCYNARITTGAVPSTVTIERPWASGFIFGLVPPQAIDASETCTNGVAIVETKLSFLNQLVAGLTFSIYTPMHITVTCAATTSELSTESDIDFVYFSPEMSLEDKQAVLTEAAYKSNEKKMPVYVLLN
jgi:hypothetical protein